MIPGTTIYGVKCVTCVVSLLNGGIDQHGQPYHLGTFHEIVSTNTRARGKIMEDSSMAKKHQR